MFLLFKVFFYSFFFFFLMDRDSCEFFFFPDGAISI